jgi:hypothetical protein
MKFNNYNNSYQNYDKKKKNAMSESEELVSFSSLLSQSVNLKIVDLK